MTTDDAADDSAIGITSGKYPTDSDGSAIQVGDDDAALRGVLRRVDAAVIRGGDYVELVQHRVVCNGNKINAETTDSILLFLNSERLGTAGEPTFTLAEPCPASPVRFANANLLLTAAGAPVIASRALAYQRRLGCLMYLANSVRPDLAFTIGMHCRNMGSPTPELLHELDHTFSYLSRHSDVGLTYESVPTDLHAFTDASLDVGKSTSGYLVKWQGAAISWGSTRQKSTVLSSCEAEIYALSEGAKDIVYFRKLLSGLGEDLTAPSNCSTDNKGAADLSYNPEHHKRSKHIERRHFYIRDMVEALELRVPLVRTDEDLADMLTKVLAPREFFRWRAMIMNEQVPYMGLSQVEKWSSVRSNIYFRETA